MKRGEIWLINLDPTVGAEIRKTRPAIIVNVDAVGVLPLKVIVPVTEWKTRYQVAPWMVQMNPDSENNLEKLSCADTFQIRSVSQRRFVSLLGKMNHVKMQELESALSKVLGI
jgi:mRNA interferase MazF